MPEVNNPPRHRKKKLPAERRRVILSVRVLPSTMQYLEAMGYSTNGRALDCLVAAIQHPGVRDMVNSGCEFSILNLNN